MKENKARELRNNINPERKESLKETFKKASKSDKKPYSIRLSEFLMENTEKYSNLMNINKSDLINDLLNKHLENRLLERTQIHFYFQFFEKGENDYLLEYLDKENSSNQNYMDEYFNLMDYNEDKGYLFLEEIYLNNFLDNWDHGTYKAKGFNDHYHEGLLISSRRDKYYYVLWHLTENNLLSNNNVIIIKNLNKFIKINKLKEINRKEALELALDRNNTNLIKTIENVDTIKIINNSMENDKFLGVRNAYNEKEHAEVYHILSNQIRHEISKDFEKENKELWEKIAKLEAKEEKQKKADKIANNITDE